ncbi:TetR/AcrR family transcriptional regulator [Actinoplanes sp. RD1]|uniref:TetR/AcrR family transcriptional regulator n=1 Tax=Actinoplanes sp. RD1 TaxID=3064538 RepID=UPI002741A029|nr:TetR/AcrR family transcriptional regulator [Actinoplanes sp. RD1]
MPKRVDHEVRRKQIAEAVWRIAATRGLQAATLREVAAEAGVSVRLVQYYFETKDRLLLAALHYVTRAMADRMGERLRALGRPPGPRDVMRICLVEALPTDDESLMMARVHGAFYSAALTDPALAAAAAAGPDPLPQDSMEKVLTAQIRRAQEEGEIPATADATQEARGLGALAAGLSSMVLVGARTPGEAVEVVTYRLDRLFTAPPPAT